MVIASQSIIDEARVVLHHHQIISRQERALLLHPLLHPAAWPTYFCAKNHQQHNNKDKGKQYPAPARQRPSSYYEC
jgi:hypothetical protein